MDSPLTLNQPQASLWEAPTPPPSRLAPQRHIYSGVVPSPTAQPSRLSGPPPPGLGRALTRRESGDPRNLIGDLCSEHREVLLVAFEVGRHGGSGVAGPGRSLGQDWGYAGQEKTV